jgi:hypothetical protein
MISNWNFKNIKINTRKIFFYFILIQIVILPLTLKADLILFGSWTEGVVINSSMCESSFRNRHSTYEPVAQIEFTVENEVILFYVSTFVIYPIGKKVNVIYEKGNPRNCIISHYYLLYLDKVLVLVILSLFVWIPFKHFFQE